MDWRLPGVKEVVAGDGEKGGGYKWAVGGVGGLVFREGSGSGRHQGQHPAARLCPFSNPLPLGGLGGGHQVQAHPACLTAGQATEKQDVGVAISTFPESQQTKETADQCPKEAPAWVWVLVSCMEERRGGGKVNPQGPQTAASISRLQPDSGGDGSSLFSCSRSQAGLLRPFPASCTPEPSPQLGRGRQGSQTWAAGVPKL